MAILLLSVVACSGAGNNSNGDGDRSTSSEATRNEDTPAAAPVDPNDLIANCLLERGLDVRRSGEVDGEMNAGVDLSHIDQTDPHASAAIEECSSLADATSRGDQDAPSAEAAQAGFDAYMQKMSACMLDHGFHLTAAGPSGEVSGTGAVIEYPPGEEAAPGFQDAQTECTDAAHEAERQAQDRIDG